MGLQTVTWLFEGQVEHHDSGGYHAIVRPGEVIRIGSLTDTIVASDGASGLLHDDTAADDTAIETASDSDNDNDDVNDDQSLPG